MTFTTIIHTTDGDFGGPRIVADTWEQAEQYCAIHLGYCLVDGIFDGDFHDGGRVVEWGKVTQN